MNILISGANRGIGLALLEAYQVAGHSVTGTRRDTNEAAGWLTMDLMAPDAARRAAKAYGAKPLDLLVCNAGVYLEGGDADIDADYPAQFWAECLAVNVTGLFLTVQAFLPALRRAASPKIAVISSRMGSSGRAPGGSYIYRASKAAATNLGRNLAADLRAEGIAVGIYHPGWVRTDMGGAGADIDMQTSASGLMSRFDALSLETSGCFEDYAGSAIPF
ncbi:MAG: SDR family NAD(P)-dependent oxidoreductase [Paracoccaceae bacterium]